MKTKNLFLFFSGADHKMYLSWYEDLASRCFVSWYECILHKNSSEGYTASEDIGEAVKYVRAKSRSDALSQIYNVLKELPFDEKKTDFLINLLEEKSTKMKKLDTQILRLPRRAFFKRICLKWRFRKFEYQVMASDLLNLMGVAYTVKYHLGTQEKFKEFMQKEAEKAIDKHYQEFLDRGK